MPATLDGLKVRLHSTAAGSLPAGDVSDRFTVRLVPGLAEPEDKASASVWALAGLVRTPRAKTAAAPQWLVQPNRTGIRKPSISLKPLPNEPSPPARSV